MANGGETLLLQGKFDVHQIEQRITLEAEGHAHVLVREQTPGFPGPGRTLDEPFTSCPTADPWAMPCPWISPGCRLSMGVPIKFPAIGPSARPRQSSPHEDSTWRLFRICTFWPNTAMSPMRWISVLGSPGAGCVYGLCSWKEDGHVYMAPAGAVSVNAQELQYGFNMLLGQSDGPDDVVRRATQLLWDKYGRESLRKHPAAGPSLRRVRAEILLCPKKLSMGVSAWWRLYWAEHFKAFSQSPEVKQSVVELAASLPGHRSLPVQFPPTMTGNSSRPPS